MDMLDMSVTLIVKAPNQQIEDQTIKCEPTWTIKKLKGHLSEVYPSKPRTEDQKLIYSGQLLPDSVILRDILRWYEGQEAHTVHLVCTPPRDCGRRAGSRPQPRMSEKRHLSPHSTAEEAAASSSDPSSTDGLRQRLSAAEMPAAGSTSASQFPAPDPSAAWAAAVAQPYLGYDPNNMVQQLALMQQAYAQYMAQYMHMLASGGNPQSIQTQIPQVQTSVAPQQVPDPVIPPAVNQDQGAEPAVENILVEGEEDGRGNRDWLDWFYFMSRLMVMFSVVYFYSSPTRFIIVSALGIMMYLYQVGFFRIQQQHLQVARIAPENNNVAVDGRAVDNNNVERNQVDSDAQRSAQNGGSEGEEPGPEPDRPSLLALTWTFFTSFFASLIPEQPGGL